MLGKKKKNSHKDEFLLPWRKKNVFLLLFVSILVKKKKTRLKKIHCRGEGPE